MSILKKLSPYLLILIFSLPSVLPLLQSGFFPIHDNTQVARVYEMSKALSDGMFPVRLVEDLGYGFGYPIFNFYAPLPYYIGGLIDLLLLDPLQATKLMIVIGTLFSGVSMFLFSRSIFGRIPAYITSIFYVYAAYHAVNIYVRGAVSELWAYGLIPFVFWGLFRLSKERNLKWIAVSGVSFAGVVLSHNLTALMAAPFVIFYISYLAFTNKRNFRWEVFLKSILALLLGLSLSSFYWIPAVAEIGFTNVYSQVEGGSDFRVNFVCLSQLWYSPWGFGGSIPGCLDGLSLSPGKINLLLLPVSIILLLLIKLRRINDSNLEKMQHTLLFSVLFLFSLFLTLDLSRPVWEVVGPMEFLQYPWRFLLFASFFSSLLSGGIIWLLSQLFENEKKKRQLLLVGVVVLLLSLFYTNLKLFSPQEHILKSSTDYTNDREVKWVVSKISDEYMPKSFKKPVNDKEVSNGEVEILSGDIEIVKSDKAVNKWMLDIRSFGESVVLLPLAYYPSWTADLEDKKLELVEDPKGMKLNLPSGEYKINLEFKETSTQKLGNLISIAGLLALIAGIIKSRVSYGKKS